MPMRPQLPTFLPCIEAPWAWAQSSSTSKPCSLAKSQMWSISQGSPHECMGTMARTRGLSTFLACSRSNVAVRGLMSTNTGTQPKNRIVVMVPKKV